MHDLTNRQPIASQSFFVPWSLPWLIVALLNASIATRSTATTAIPDATKKHKQ
jgi:hypothetical protein